VHILSASSGRTLGENLNRLVSETTGDFMLRMDDDDYYGPHYIEDMYYAWAFSRADLVGKEASYVYLESQNATYLTLAHREHCFTDFVRGPTFAGPRRTFEAIGFEPQNQGEDTAFLKKLIKEGGRIYSTDRFNFVYRRSSRSHQHTWVVDDLALASTGDLRFMGAANDQVCP